MNYLSVCSGIEAATVAWHQLGWNPVAFSEIEPFPSAVLRHHYPTVANAGDMTRFQEWNIGSVDLLVGGTPCQSFSVAGLRQGLADPRGNLALVYCGILDHFRPKWFVWENVPGVLSSGSGRDFGSFLGAVAELGYGFAYRVLDAQYFGVAQRRRRVFVVGHLGDWRSAATVLFERESLRRDTAPSRKAREVAPTIPARSTAGGGLGTDFDCDGGVIQHEDGTGRGTPLVPVAFAQNSRDEVRLMGGDGGIVGALAAEPGMKQTCYIAQQAVPVGLDEEQNAMDDAFGTLKARTKGGGFEGSVMQPNMQVRRLTPVECERLQGFPDGYTNIPWRGKPESPDGPRYKALGNSMAVPVMRWIGERIAFVRTLA